MVIQNEGKGTLYTKRICYSYAFWSYVIVLTKESLLFFIVSSNLKRIINQLDWLTMATGTDQMQPPRNTIIFENR